MKRLLFIIVLVALNGFPIQLQAQTDEEWGCNLITGPDPYNLTIQRGGRYFTPTGTVKALVVFVQLKDDNTYLVALFGHKTSHPPL